MHDESTKQPCCNPPWEPPQVIPAQVRRVNNLIFRKINQFHRENNVDNVTPMHNSSGATCIRYPISLCFIG